MQGEKARTPLPSCHEIPRDLCFPGRGVLFDQSLEQDHGPARLPILPVRMGAFEEGAGDCGALGIVPEDGLKLEERVGVLPLAIEGFSQPVESPWLLSPIWLSREVCSEVLDRGREVSLDIFTNRALVYLLRGEGLLSFRHLGPDCLGRCPFQLRIDGRGPVLLAYWGVAGGMVLRNRRGVFAGGRYRPT